MDLRDDTENYDGNATIFPQRIVFRSRTVRSGEPFWLLTRLFHVVAFVRLCQSVAVARANRHFVRTKMNVSTALRL